MDIPTQIHQTYKTADIILAACLIVKGHDLATIEKDSSTKGTFIFKLVPEEFIFQYDLGKMLVEPIAFNNAIKRLTTSVRRMT